MVLPPQALTHLKPPSALIASVRLVERLNNVPAFVLINASGQALTARSADGKEAIGVFFRSQAAQAFLTKLIQQNPGVGDGLKLKVMRLGELYQMTQKPGGEAPSLALVPDSAQVEKAKELLRERGKPEYKAGVPLFMAELPGKGLLTVTQNAKNIVPVFFNRDAVLPMIERYNKARPEGAPEAKLAMVTLEFLLESWRKGADQAIEQMQLMIDNAVLEDVKAVSGGA